MSETDTICALSSAAGRAGVAVVRVSGPQAVAMAQALAGAQLRPRRAALRSIRDPRSGEEIDCGIVLTFPAPRSFTGEHVSELHVHGGRAVVAGVLDALVALGCRLAEPGEFARRAFDNGKIDLTQAEGIADLIEAETEAQRRQAVRQAKGITARLYEDWREQLIGALALMEAAIDFADEADVAPDTQAQVRERASALMDQISAHLDDGRRGEILREGFQVVLAGPPNAGKSSLLNALARRDVAIVSPEAGTTRDVIEVRLDLDGLPIIVSDTAGLRAAEGAVEREGVRRTLARGRDADLVIWLMEAGSVAVEPPAALTETGSALQPVLSKVDLAGDATAIEAGLLGHGATKSLAVSAVTGVGLAALVARIAELARARLQPGEAPVVTQARHRQALQACQQALATFLDGDMTQPELRAEDLRHAAQALGRITGRIDAEDVLDQVFGRFCIGK